MRREIARAWDLFDVGALSAAEALLAPFRSNPAALELLLWIALRRGDIAAKQLYGGWLATSADPELSAVGRAHENVALRSSGNELKPWFCSSSKWANAEVAYARALIAFANGDGAGVRKELSSALPQRPEQRVRYAQLRAWIAGLDDRFERQATYLLHALTIATKERIDAVLVARIAEALAHLIRELELEDLGGRAEHLLEAVMWPKEETTYRFYAQRALAWRKSLRGEWIEALHLLDATLLIAPDHACRGVIFADRARINRAAGEDASARSACTNALDCFDQIDWSGATRDEATVVFGAMDVLRTEPERAARLYQAAASANVSKLSGMAHGRRFEAFRRFALSHVSDGKDALEHTHQAYITFKEIKYLHRAASCALRAVELHGGSRWRKRVERLVSSYPRSLVARELAQLSSPLERVRGRRREIVEMLISTNKTAREIGETLGIAEGTVRVHIKRINKLFKTESRSELVRLLLTSTRAA